MTDEQKEALKSNILKGEDLVKMVGVELYGNKFSIQQEHIKCNYKVAYEHFVKSVFEKNDKGLLIIGGIGAGKSAMMRVMQRVFKDTDRKFRWINAYDLKDMSEVYTIGEIKQSYGGDLLCDLYIDDIGFAMDVKRYGNTVNIISEILIERYDLFVSSGFRTHLSSNIPTSIKDPNNKLPTLESIYGARVLDRIKEMCNLLTFKGDSLRK